MPQWLKEVISRGFKPSCTYEVIGDSMFAFISSQSNSIIHFPDRKLLVLEGIPGSGKTTILRSMKNSNLEKVKQILPSEPIFDQDMNQKFYFNSDILKTRKFFETNKHVCIMDRYYSSTLAFYWAYDKLFKTNKYKIAYNWYQRSVKNFSLVKPFWYFI